MTGPLGDPRLQSKGPPGPSRCYLSSAAWNLGDYSPLRSLFTLVSWENSLLDLVELPASIKVDHHWFTKEVGQLTFDGLGIFKASRIEVNGTKALVFEILHLESGDAACVIELPGAGDGVAHTAVRPALVFIEQANGEVFIVVQVWSSDSVFWINHDR